MKSCLKRVSFSILCILLSTSIALAEKKNKEKDKNPHKNHKTTSASANVRVNIFLGNDRELIRHHFVPNPRKLPPGLAKRRGDLPPGLAKQLVRKGHLPPGLEKKLYPFPIELERTLPPLQPGLVRGIIGGSAVIFNVKTRVILDVFAVF